MPLKGMKANMKKFLISGVILSVLVMLATHAFAQSETDMTTNILQGLQNFNGSGTATATNSPSVEQFKSSVLMKAGMGAMDTDRNGTISKAELAVVTNKLFDVADSNHDAQLSEDELATFSANMTKVLSMLR
jgi:predicted negative regulator of RcsB-dependent stress response